MRFSQEKLQEALSVTPLKIAEVIKQNQVVYVEFNNSNISCIRIHAGEFEEKNNCINIYHGESAKNGYWWDGELDYRELVSQLLLYNSPMVQGLSEYKILPLNGGLL